MKVLVVERYGCFIGCRNGKVVVRSKREKLAEEPAVNLRVVRVKCRGTSISGDFIRLAVRHGIFTVFTSSSGRPIGVVAPFIPKSSILVRREQYKAYSDYRCIELARGFIYGKIHNQESLLRSVIKSKRSLNTGVKLILVSTIEELRDLRNSLYARSFNDVQEARTEILSIEAIAAEKYWSCWKTILPEELEFPGRRKRSDMPEDPVNIMLNYLYSILASEVWIALLVSGLDPIAGFLHMDSPRRPGLVYDLMEEFRAPIVDKVVLNIALKEGGSLKSWIDDRMRLTKEARMLLSSSMLERLEVKYSYGGVKLPFRLHILRQSRKIVRYLRGMSPRYVPFRWK